MKQGSKSSCSSGPTNMATSENPIIKSGYMGRDGRDGRDGNPGAPGAPGRDGRPGKDGKGVPVLTPVPHRLDPHVRLPWFFGGQPVQQAFIGLTTALDTPQLVQRLEAHEAENKHLVNLLNQLQADQAELFLLINGFGLAPEEPVR